MIKKIPFAMIATALIAMVALLALPWIATELDGEKLTSSMLDIIKSKEHGYQIGYVLLGSLALALLVGGLSLTRSRRWLTALAAVALVIPTFLSAVAAHAALGAHVAMVASGLALASAIALTIKPVRPAVRTA